MAAEPRAPAAKVGDRVEIRYTRDNKWYGATVVGVNNNGTYNAIWDDGGRVRGAKQADVKRFNFVSFADRFGVEIRRSGGRQPILSVDEATTSDKLVLGYYGTRGRAEPLRTMLAYAGISYTDLHFMSPDSWFKGCKPGLAKQLPMINLPFVKDVNGTLITQSKAVYKYIADKADLRQKTLKQDAWNNMFLEECYDFNSDAAGVWYKGGDPDKYVQVAMDTRLKKFEQWMNSHREYKFLVGNKPAACDFFFVELLQGHAACFKGCLKKFPLITKYKMTFENEPRIKDFIAGRDKRVFNAPGFAKWGTTMAESYPVWA